MSNVNPFYFIDRCQLAYSIIECIVFAIMLKLLIFNLYNLRCRQSGIIVLSIADSTNEPIVNETLAASTLNEEDLPMNPSPKILL
jgi:hypothetical protein